MFSIFDFIKHSVSVLCIFCTSTKSMSSLRAGWISVNSGLNNVKYFF